MNSTIAAQNVVIDQLKIQTDNNQQYQRRSSVRVHGIISQENETETDIDNMLGNLYNELNLTIKKDEIDRAHRIGPKYKVDGETCQSKIIKFSNWEARKKFYLALSSI